MVKQRNVLVQAIGKARAAEKPGLESVQNCTLVDNTNWDIPKGQYLYGIRLKNGEYKKVVASDTVNAACKLGILLSDIQRSMPIKYGG